MDFKFSHDVCAVGVNSTVANVKSSGYLFVG